MEEAKAPHFKAYAVQTIFGTFWFEGESQEDARKRFWVWYWEENEEARSYQDILEEVDEGIS